MLMKLGILSDTHDNLGNTRRALDIFKQHQVEHLIHCGDITTPQVLGLFAGWSATFVFGNLDHEQIALTTAAGRLAGEITIGFQYAGAFEGMPFVVYHGNDDEYLASLIEGRRYQYVFHGHTHQRRDEKFGHTRVINPGALGGRGKTRSICILSLPDGLASFIEIEEQT
jgi:putative phosphoesterase